MAIVPVSSELVSTILHSFVDVSTFSSPESLLLVSRSFPSSSSDDSICCDVGAPQEEKGGEEEAVASKNAKKQRKKWDHDLAKKHDLAKNWGANYLSGCNDKKNKNNKSVNSECLWKHQSKNVKNAREVTTARWWMKKSLIIPTLKMAMKIPNLTAIFTAMRSNVLPTIQTKNIGRSWRLNFSIDGSRFLAFDKAGRLRPVNT